MTSDIVPDIMQGGQPSAKVLVSSTSVFPQITGRLWELLQHMCMDASSAPSLNTPVMHTHSDIGKIVSLLCRSTQHDHVVSSNDTPCGCISVTAPI